MLFCLASDVVETEFLFIFVQINKGKQLFIPLANRGNFIRRLFEPGMAVVSTVLCLDLRIGAGTGTGRFSCSGSCAFLLETKPRGHYSGAASAVASRSGFLTKSPCCRLGWILGAAAVI